MALVAKSRGQWTPAWKESGRTGASDAIAQLDARMVFGRQLTSGGNDPAAGAALGRIVQVRHRDWRIDRQKSVGGIGDTPGKINLQVQPNGTNIESPSSVACLIVPNDYFYQIAGPEHANREAELTRVLRNGLIESMKSWVRGTQAGSGKRSASIEVYEVSGEFSSPRPVPPAR
jgi:hypothetical protein